MRMRCYLLALQISPFEAGEYKVLPLHCTLVHRFLSPHSPEALDVYIKPLIERSLPLTVTSGQVETFGPPPVTVNVVMPNSEHSKLHTQLVSALTEAQVEFTAPQWIGSNYRPHVTQHGNMSLPSGVTITSHAAHLIEVKIPEMPGKKIIRKTYKA
jgi:2'-5' RNA ligase